MKQVNKSHYNFSRYINKARWSSLWHQVDEAMKLSPDKVLEVGPGPGVFKAIAQISGLDVETLDIDSELNPTYVGAVTNIPLPDSYCDLVCAFQMLEHLPYEQSINGFVEMVRVSKKYVLISLPDAKEAWRYAGHIPKFGWVDYIVTKPFFLKKHHKFDGEHHWELNKYGYEFDKVVADLNKHAFLIKNFRVKENTYHHFLLFSKNC